MTITSKLHQRLLRPNRGVAFQVGEYLRRQYTKATVEKRAVTYWLAYQTMLDGNGGEVILELGGLYKDRLVRQDRWRISERIDLGTWVRTPLPFGIQPPAWYGTMNHHKAELL